MSMWATILSFGLGDDAPAAFAGPPIEYGATVPSDTDPRIGWLEVASNVGDPRFLRFGIGDIADDTINVDFTVVLDLDQVGLLHGALETWLNAIKESA